MQRSVIIVAAIVFFSLFTFFITFTAPADAANFCGQKEFAAPDGGDIVADWKVHLAQVADGKPFGYIIRNLTGSHCHGKAMAVGMIDGGWDDGQLVTVGLVVVSRSIECENSHIDMPERGSSFAMRFEVRDDALYFPGCVLVNVAADGQKTCLAMGMDLFSCPCDDTPLLVPPMGISDGDPGLPAQTGDVFRTE